MADNYLERKMADLRSGKRPQSLNSATGVTRLNQIKYRALNNKGATREEAIWLANYPNLNILCDTADEITRHNLGTRVDSCSIVNARSGLCGEDCKWCAQSAHHSTGCGHYAFIPESDLLEAAIHNNREGIARLSLVTSGRTVGKKDLEQFCNMIRHIGVSTGLKLCASMGLLGEEEMRMLKDSGVTRYHCNMETSSEYFPKLCTTHTPEDKRRTIAAARKAGLEVCSGGIIGMGETMADRVDFALELRDLGVNSVPINILNPIKGTPLENIGLISEEEIIRTVAMFRFVMPATPLRFAGGRMRLSHTALLRIMKGGMNGVLMGDMLTTVSNTISDDRKLFAEAHLDF